MTLAEQIAAKLHPWRWERVQKYRETPHLYSVSMVDHAESGWRGVVGEVEQILQLAAEMRGSD